jgi:hypothetical protein
VSGRRHHDAAPLHLSDRDRSAPSATDTSDPSQDRPQQPARACPRVADPLLDATGQATMIPESARDGFSTARFPAHARAADRHMQWALDFAAAGDDAAAAGAIRDLQAVVSEVSRADPDDRVFP